MLLQQFGGILGDTEQPDPKTLAQVLQAMNQSYRPVVHDRKDSSEDVKNYKSLVTQLTRQDQIHIKSATRKETIQDSIEKIPASSSLKGFRNITNSKRAGIFSSSTSNKSVYGLQGSKSLNDLNPGRRRRKTRFSNSNKNKLVLPMMM